MHNYDYTTHLIEADVHECLSYALADMGLFDEDPDSDDEDEDDVQNLGEDSKLESDFSDFDKISADTAFDISEY
jgi:hypothetical protein